MNGKKTIIAYETKGGVTGEYANIIAEVLRREYGFSVDVVNLRVGPEPELSEYDDIFIGSGIRAGKWYKRAEDLLRIDFEGKNVAIFVSACSAGSPKNHGEAVAKYLDDVLAKYPHLRPFATAAFGGRVKVLGKVITDNCNPDEVRAWAGEVVGKLVSRK